MQQLTDTLETLILLALEAEHEYTVPGDVRRSKAGKQRLYDQGQLLRFDPMFPESSYLVDLNDDSRLLTTSADYLACHPGEILGDLAETIVLDETKGVFKWFGFRKLRAAPKGVSYLGRPTHWYEIHARSVAVKGGGCYYKRVVPFDRNGSPLVAKVGGHLVCDPRVDGVTPILSSSIIEDAHRSNTMLAAVKDIKELKFPVPLDDYKEVFSKRDGPMNGSRRKAIIHWVAKHMRRSTKGKDFTVKKHTRGVQEFTIDGLTVSITPNDLNR